MAPPPAPDSVNTVVTNVSPESGNRHGVLTVTTGLDAGRVVTLGPGVSTFGRAAECTHRFEDRRLSRVHAQVIGVAGGYVIHDPSSRNGTFVNGARITVPTPLVDGDRVQLGSDTLLRFALVTDAEEAGMRAIYEAAHRDGLTGAFNRKAFDERLEEEIAFATRHGAALSVVLFDVDRFKSVNDTYGHPIGDAVLRALVKCFTRELRIEDVLGRYGGEEFVVLTREIDLAGALVCAERLRVALASEDVKKGDDLVLATTGAPLRVTASAGVASLACCGEKRDAATLLGLADKRLYMAKESGRNRVCAG